MVTYVEKKTDKHTWGLNFWWEKAAFVIGAVWFWAVIASVSLWTLSALLESLLS